MIAFIALCYASLYLLIFNKLGLLQKSVANISAFAGVGVVLIGAVVFVWFTYSPMSQDARLFRFIVPIVPNVKGQVIEVPIQGKESLAEGDVLFRIDPTPYEYAARQLESQVARHEAEWRLAKVNVDRAAMLVARQSGAQVDLDLWTANMDMAAAAVESTKAQLENAQWQLGETTVRAPADGYVVNLQVRPGNFVTSIPMASSMPFVTTDSNPILASFSQSAIRKISEGNSVEVSFSHVPGQVFSGTVARVVGVGAQAQLTASGQLPSFTGAPVNDRWAVIAQLDDEEFARSLHQGAGGTMVVYTDAGEAFHIISKVAIRMTAWMGYLTSP